MQVYLSGPITGLTVDEARDWRAEATEMLAGLECLCPMRGKSHEMFSGRIWRAREDQPLASPRGITVRDRWDAMRCDVMLVYLVGAERVSIGTVMEIAWADAQRTPIVLVMDEGNLHDHSMIRESVGYIVNDLESACGIVRVLCNA